MSEIGKDITASLSVEKIIEKTYEKVNSLMDASVFGIGLYNQEQNHIDIPALMEKGEKMPFLFYSLDDNLRPAVWCFKNQKEMFMNDLLNDYNNYFPDTPLPQPTAGEVPNSLIYLPLSLQNKKIGVITVQSFEKNAYTSYHLDILRNLTVYIATALENARLYENVEAEVKQQTQELIEQKNELEKSYYDVRLMSEIGKDITASLSVEKIIEKTYEKVNSLMDASVFGIGLYNQEQNRIDRHGTMEKGEKMPFFFYSLDDTLRPAVWCFKNQKEFFTNDYLNDYNKFFPNADVPQPVAGEYASSIIYLPLSIQNKKIGVITVQSFEKNAYTSYHLDILRNLTVYVATAMENARLYENMEVEVKERTNEVVEQKEKIELSYKNIKTLSEIGQVVTSTLSVEKIIEKTYEKVNSLMDASAFGIGLFNQEQNGIDFPGVIEKGEKMPFFFYSLDDTLRPAVWCLKNKKEFFTNDYLNDYNKFFPDAAVPQPVSGEQAYSTIYLPLIIQNKKIGVITVQSFKKNAYTRYHLDILRNLTVYVATALENARLYENMESEVKQRTLEVIRQKEELEEKSKALQQSHHNITLLSEIGQKITSTLNLERILDTVYENVIALMDTTEFGIGIYNEEEQVIIYPYQYYQSERVARIEKVSMRDDNRLSVWCVKNKKEIFINDMDHEYSRYISTMKSYGTNTPGSGNTAFLLQSLICLPLIIEKKVIGIVFVQSSKKNAYLPLQLEMFRTLASYTAAALNNSEAYKKLNAAMREVEKLSIVASKSENTIVICNTDTELIWANDAFTKTLGYTLEEYKKEKGKTLTEVSSNPEIRKLINECIEKKSGVLYESKNMTKYNGLRWFQTTLSPVFDEMGKLQNIVFIDSDITELKNTQTQLIQSEKMASLGQLTAGVAHEINNPINFVSAGIDSIKQNYNDLKILLDAYENLHKNSVVPDHLLQIENLKKKLDYKSLMVEMDHLIKSVKNGAMRTTEIIKSLRNFSRLDEYALKKADIHEGIDSTLTILTNKFKNRIEVVKDYNSMPSINCFPGQLNQVFMNILSNAIDAIEGTVTIRIKTKNAGNNVEVRIKDSGKGMTEEVKRKIFEPFFTTKNVGEGTGLGLSISYGIIEKHKGSISVESALGKGTEFIIQIPMNLS